MTEFDYCVDPAGIWHHANELLELHDVDAHAHAHAHAHANAACMPSKSLSSPRSNKSTLTGALSLHDYHKSLSQSQSRYVDRTGRTLKHKTAARNLNKSPPPISSSVSLSSAASSPPPLSPSYSHSVVSHHSEHDSESDQSGHLVSAHLVRPRPNRKRLNTFRDSQTNTQTEHSPVSRERSDPMLAHGAVTTISLGGTSFEILNPRKSLDLARIVSFIEDVDGCSILSDAQDSRVSSNALCQEQGLDRFSLSQFTDASLPSHYSPQSLYTSRFSSPKSPPTDVPSSSRRIHDRIRSLSEYSTDSKRYSQSIDLKSPIPNHNHDPDQLHQDLVGDISNSAHITSISERLEERPDSASQHTFYSEESEIGEPGSPVYANGEWDQVDERDRGIFFDIPPPPEPVQDETFVPSYTYNYDPYDPIYFDPHVQAVLAAANSENMGLRANASHDLHQHRGNESRYYGDGRPRLKGNDRKHSFSQRMGLRRLFSRRGN